MAYKKYVDIVIRENRDGELLPIYVVLEDGYPYAIDSIISEERKSSNAGGGGICYLCLIQGKRNKLFQEKERWFIEYS